ncbi:MAG: hypothetical protein Q9209_000611 [Squamulea sp. 1 TL-2023]
MAYRLELVSPQDGLVQGFERYWESGTGADMTVICQGETFRCHSAIICSRSPYFEAAFFGSFEEGLTKTIDLSADNLPLIRRMLKYFYVLDYSEDEDDVGNAVSEGAEESLSSNDTPEIKETTDANNEPTNEIDESSDGNSEEPEASEVSTYIFRLQLHMQMFTIGDKYNIPCLKHVAADKFHSLCTYLSNNWNLKACTNALIAAVPLLYDSTSTIDDRDSLLRQSLVEQLGEAFVYQFKFVDDTNFKECLEYPEFSYDIMKSIMHARYLKGSPKSTGRARDVEW